MFCIILGLIFWMKGRKKEGRIATPACAPVRNDRFFGNAVHIGSGVRAPRPTGAGHGVRCERDVEDAVPYGRFVGGRADGTMWASSPTELVKRL